MEKEHLQRLEALLKESPRYSELSPEDEIVRYEQLEIELGSVLNTQMISDSSETEKAFEPDGTVVTT